MIVISTANQTGKNFATWMHENTPLKVQTIVRIMPTALPDRSGLLVLSPFILGVMLCG
jgi:hypothetical protein